MAGLARSTVLAASTMIRNLGMQHRVFSLFLSFCLYLPTPWRICCLIIENSRGRQHDFDVCHTHFLVLTCFQCNIYGVAITSQSLRSMGRETVLNTSLYLLHTVVYPLLVSIIKVVVMYSNLESVCSAPRLLAADNACQPFWTSCCPDRLGYFISRICRSLRTPRPFLD